jgi:hypothetical protein
MRVWYATVAAAVLAATTLGAQSGRNKREGIWIGIGAGPGNAGTYCDQCPEDRTWGFSGSVRIGGTIASNLLLGFETNGLLGTVDTVDSRLGFASLTATLFPSQYNNFFVKIGLGGMKYYAAQPGSEIDALAPSVMGGIGYEFEVGRNSSLVVVPYFNYLASTSVDVQVNGQPVPTSSISVNLFQLGLGLLWR